MTCTEGVNSLDGQEDGKQDLVLVITRLFSGNIIADEEKRVNHIAAPM